MTTRRQLLQASGALALAPLATHGQTPAWPSKPVRLVVPSASGSPWDPIARHLAERFSKAFGQPFFVENKAGAGGNLGADRAFDHVTDFGNQIQEIASRLRDQRWIGGNTVQEAGGGEVFNVVEVGGVDEEFHGIRVLVGESDDQRAV